MESLRVKVKKVIFTNDETSYMILSCSVMALKKNQYKESARMITVQGPMINIRINDVLEIEAVKKYKEGFGYSYHLSSYQKILPGTLEEMKRFLMCQKGIGTKSADKLLETYGLSVLQKIIEDPTALDCIPLSYDVKAQIRESITIDQSFESVLGFLVAHKLDHRFAVPLFMKYKEKTVRVLETSPYLPYLERIVDFRTSEILCYNSQIAFNDPMRTAMVLYGSLTFDSKNKGNIYTPGAQLERLYNHFLSSSKSPYINEPSFSSAEVDSALAFLFGRGYIHIDRDVLFNDVAIYIKSNYYNEEKIVNMVGGIVNSVKSTHYNPNDITSAINKYIGLGNTTSQEQCNAIRNSLTNPISIITGGPGTGKTNTIQGLLYCIQQLSPYAKVALTAPTGKAANRMAEVTNKPGQTIHRLIRYSGAEDAASALDDYLSHDYIIVDEFSMADANLTSKFLEKVSPMAKVVFVGDCDQLPSVGAGRVLHDFIESKAISVSKLTKVFRQGQGSSIITNARTVINYNDNSIPLDLDLTRDNNGMSDFYFLQEEYGEKIQEHIVGYTRQLLQSGFKLSDIQVVSPVRMGELGVDNLNTLLQEEFNPTLHDSNVFEGLDKEFRVGDKVIHTVNNYDLNVFNGETGIVKSVSRMEDDALIVEFTGGKEVSYKSSDVEQLDLAYAITVHKSQGSEFPIVIFPVHRSLEFGLNKNLIYTGFTRAKDTILLVGEMPILANGASKKGNDRVSTLCSKLQNYFSII